MPDGHPVHRIYQRIAAHYRPKRMRAFVARLGITERTRVLDVGGTAYNWQFSPVQPRLTILNLEPRHADCPSWIDWIQGDALTMRVDRGVFDVVFSNSVIEHVPDHQRFAQAIRGFGVPYWVQTPNRYFPVEPHFLGLGVQFLPRWAATPYVKHATLWGRRAKDQHHLVPEKLDEINLLAAREMRWLFPDADIVRERSAGLTKSLIAVHD